MLRNGFRRKFPNEENDFRFFYTNNDVHRICNSRDVSEFIKIQQRNYAAHLIRSDNSYMTKKLLFQEDKCSKRGRNTNTLFKQVLNNFGYERQIFINKSIAHKF